MSKVRYNTQMFALSEPPARTIQLQGATYQLVRVFKHDFFAATCLYELLRSAGEANAATIPKVVVKFGRSQPFWGLRLSWLGRLCRDRERKLYQTLQGIDGVPRWAGSFGQTAFAIEYIDALPLDHLNAPPPGFFDRLKIIFDAIHARGVAYCDANKRSNILVDSDGRPYLIDYQISIRRRDDLPWPLRNILALLVDYLIAKDIYHLYKHKRRLCPDELTPEEDALSRHRRGPHALHRTLTKHWRSIRRFLLRKGHEEGKLASPTAELEDHHQPEKATWRK